MVQSASYSKMCVRYRIDLNFFGLFVNSDEVTFEFSTFGTSGPPYNITRRGHLQNHLGIV